MSPKQFMLHYLTSPNSELAYLRRHWAQPTGIESSVELIQAIGAFMKQSPAGRQAIEIVRQEEPPTGVYPQGSFQSSTTVEADFFSAESRDRQDASLTTNMPFLSNVLMGMLPAQNPQHHRFNEEEELAPKNGSDANTTGVNSTETSDRLFVGEDTPGALTGIDMDYIGYEENTDGHNAATMRFRRIVLTVCAMMAFAVNRRCNSLQLNNAVRLMACGVSERVQDYLNHVGLSSSRRSALSAMSSLATEAAADLRVAMRLNQSVPIAPTICIDNIDMEQRVHDPSVGHRSHTFRGTWGYVHVPDSELVSSLVLPDLSLQSYHASIEKVKSMTIEPHMFLPTPAKDQTNAMVWKAQIAKVLFEYLAVPKDRATAIPMASPVIEQITPKKPKIHMLKLMNASDNSAEGVGQVFQLIIGQSGLSVKDFFSRLQPMDGDLGTVQNFNCLKSQRSPIRGITYTLEHCDRHLHASLWKHEGLKGLWGLAKFAGSGFPGREGHPKKRLYTDD
ncbi:hypothetical protein PTTG_01728 [Puccinia triticina 1-1 BBBD Race 1]|uniref:DUF6589 domain-containing protein n=1 Tax=Puccinia triticina (isolate 1-1 / race 1 (BBBD)) TaxID=630390 RepID=A0A180GZ91_PUCT1|nr:hypothetical protein PTTG_01728 [Puccinia triticina 1-1 BBBD Race 1]